MVSPVSLILTHTRMQIHKDTHRILTSAKRDKSEALLFSQDWIRGTSVNAMKERSDTLTKHTPLCTQPP